MKHIALSILCLLASVALGAQTVPAGFKSGKLPNNATYYIVPNNSAKGYADIALVQKGNTGKEDVRKSLSDLPHFKKRKPYEFLGKLGIGYGRSGYARFSRYSISYRLPDVPMWNQNVTDSVLLAVFDLMQSYESEQALVVCGDVNTEKLLERMQTLSMFVTPRKPLMDQPKAVWSETDSLVFECSRTRDPRIGQIDLTFFSPRLSESLMGTNQPLVLELFARQLEGILRRRINDAFSFANVPLVSLNITHVSCMEDSDSELFRISVKTYKDQIAPAIQYLGTIMANASINGFVPEEINATGRAIAFNLAEKAAQGSISNERYTNMCTFSYLLGSPLITRNDVDNFVSGNVLPVGSGLPLMNRYAAALIHPDRNVTLHVGSPDFISDQRDSLVGCFNAGWKIGQGMVKRMYPQIDSTRLIGHSMSKMKVKETAVDPITGGKILTFQNGFKVLFCKSPLGTKFLYGFTVRGGSTTIPGLTEDEKSLIGEMFNMYGLEGMAPSSFRTMLLRNGIRMAADVTASEMTLRGFAPIDNLNIVLKTVLSMSNAKSFYYRDYNYWRSCRKFDNYDLSNDYPKKVDQYYTRQLSSFSNGMLILVGDFDEIEMTEILSYYAGLFKMGKPVSGRVVTEEALRKDKISADGTVYGRLTFSTKAPMMYNASRVAAIIIAQRELERALNEVLVPSGVMVRCNTSYSLFPEETMSLSLICNKCYPSGLPKGIVPITCAQTLELVQKTIANASVRDIPDDRMAAYRTYADGLVEQEISNPKYLLDAAIAKFSQGRNIIAGRKGSAASVSSAQVKEILAAFASSPIEAEYCDE